MIVAVTTMKPPYDISNIWSIFSRLSSLLEDPLIIGKTSQVNYQVKIWRNDMVDLEADA